MAYRVECGLRAAGISSAALRHRRLSAASSADQGRRELNKVTRMHAAFHEVIANADQQIDAFAVQSG